MPTDHALRELELFLANVDYERSTMGPFLDRLQLFGGAAETPTRPKRVSARFRPRPKPGDLAMPKLCRRCEAILKDETCDACSWSHTLRRYRVTAEVTAETHQSQTQPPDETRLVRYAKTSRMFQKMERTAPILAQALAAYHGVEASRYNSTASRPHCQYLAVMPMTAKGAELVRKVEKESLNAGRTDHEKLAMLIAQGCAGGKLSKAVAIAEQQAHELYDEAVELWRSL